MQCTYTTIEVGCQLVAIPTSSGSPTGGLEVGHGMRDAVESGSSE